MEVWQHREISIIVIVVIVIVVVVVVVAFVIVIVIVVVIVIVIVNGSVDGADSAANVMLLVLSMLLM